jgi:hypothetical protein
MVLAVGVALILPKTFRASGVVLVSLPRYASTLKLPPPPVDMTTVHTLATSYSVLQEMLAKVQAQREMVTAAAAKIEGDSTLWNRLGVLSATQAAELLGWRNDLVFRDDWEDLPPDYLLPGFLEFGEEDLAKLDPMLLGKALEAKIKVSIETNATTEYQPLLTLSAEWNTERTAAILVHCWAKTLIASVLRDVVQPTVSTQKFRLTQIDKTDAALQEVVEDLQNLESKSLLAIKEQERESILKDLYTGWSSVPSLHSQRDDLEREVVSTVEQLANTRKLVSDLEFRGAWIGGVANVTEVMEATTKAAIGDTETLRKNQDLLNEIDAFNLALRQSILSADRSDAQVWVSPFELSAYRLIAEAFGKVWQVNRTIMEATSHPELPISGEILSITDARVFSAYTRDILSVLQGVIERQEAYQKTLATRLRLLDSEEELYRARRDNKIEQMSADLKVYTEKLDAATRSLGMMLGQPGMNDQSPEVLKRREEIQYLEMQRAEAEDGLAAAKLLIIQLESQRKQAEDLLDDRKVYYLGQLKQLSDLSSRHQQNRRELRAIERSIDRREARADFLNQDVLKTQSKQAELELSKSTLTKQHNFVLDEVGGVEALSSDYSTLMRVHLISPPTAPKQKVAPRRSLIVLGAGFAACLMACAWVLISDQLRRNRIVVAG